LGGLSALFGPNLCYFKSNAIRLCLIDRKFYGIVALELPQSMMNINAVL